MISIYPILALLIIAAVSLLIVRIGSTALMMTGLPRETASFQSLSAFFGVGFTTKEAELVVSHPIRRRIVGYLIISGNLGITSALATFIVLILNPRRSGSVAAIPTSAEAIPAIPDTTGITPVPERIINSFQSISWFETFALGIGSVLAIFIVLNLGPIRKGTEWIIRKTLGTAGVIRPVNYDTLLRVMHGFVLSELLIEADSSLAHTTLAQSGMGSLGILVLGITREDDSYIGAPAGRDMIEPGDSLLVYAREDELASLTLHLADPEHPPIHPSARTGSFLDASNRDPSGIDKP